MATGMREIAASRPGGSGDRRVRVMGGRVMHRMLVVALAALSITGVTAHAESQRSGEADLSPGAHYWMGVTTGSGLMAMGVGGQASLLGAMRMVVSGPPEVGHSVELRLGSALLPDGAADAMHSFPPAAGVNRPVHLSEAQPGSPDPDEDDPPYQEPKGQISFYWGCGETVPSGQPVVLGFDRLMRGEGLAELAALQKAVGADTLRLPTQHNSRTFAYWPHADSRKRNRGLKVAFSGGSTLAGDHVIESNFSPRIAFTLPADRSFMAPVRYTSTEIRSSGALALAWAAMPRASGYSLGVMAPEKVDDEHANFVIWSSAERPSTFIQQQFLTPAEVGQLVKLEAVLPAGTTTCTVPAEVVKATKEGSLLMFTAFGDESTFGSPPGSQAWSARVSYKSVRMDVVSPQGMIGLAQAMAEAGASGAGLSDEEYCARLEAEQAQRPAITDVIPGGRLIGKLGRKKQDGQVDDPRCAPRQE